MNGQPVQGPFVQAADGQEMPELALTAASGAKQKSPSPPSACQKSRPQQAASATPSSAATTRWRGSRWRCSPWQAGARFVAVLRVTPHEKTGARLMINDPLPAGFEIDNPNLLRSGDLRDLDWLNPAEAKHAEFRSDRFLRR